MSRHCSAIPSAAKNLWPIWMRRARGSRRGAVPFRAPPSWSSAAAMRRGPRRSPQPCWRRRGFNPPDGAPKGYGGFIRLEKLLMLKPDLVFVKDPPIGGERSGFALFHASGDGGLVSAGAAHRAADALHHVRRAGAGGGVRLSGGGVAEIKSVTPTHASTMRASASSPSVSAAGPGCRISADLISCS